MWLVALIAKLLMTYVCENCSDGKIHRSSFPTGEVRKECKVLDLIHSDVCGKMGWWKLLCYFYR